MAPKAARPKKGAKVAKEPKEAKGKDKKVAGATGEEDQELGDSPSDLLRKEGIIATFAMNSKKVHKNVRDIVCSNLTVTFNGVPFLDDVELSLNYGNRYGYIGRNGCGKSTFMRVIGARSFPIPEGIDIFHLKEEIEATEMTAKEAVMSVDKERQKLEEEAEMLNDLMIDESAEDIDEIQDRLTQIYERLDEMDAATAETRASKILNGLGFTPEKQQKKTKDFSGGWRMRIALARALFIQPTLLLLDEPTNHLDMEAVVWLEDYLSKWTKILFMVSHSQDFMNTVCTHIVHHTKKQLVYYSGNYDQFVQTRNEKEEEQMKRFKAEQDQIAHMKEYVARFGQGNSKMAKQAQSKEKTLEKMLRSGLTDKVEVEKALDFKFIDPSPLAPPVLQCDDIAFGYPGCEILYANVSFGVDLDSRVALVGPNGAGKSTLLKLMTGDLMPVRGSIRPHAHLRISKFSQHFIDVLDLSMCPLDYFCHIFADMTREDARKFLGRYGISGAVQTQVMAQLSDGQKSRVVLAKMAKEVPHILFLDEPTNHLDMESIDSLAKAINQWTGGMVLVSHDMRLISQVAKEIWLCDNHTVTKYTGEIQDFKMRIRKTLGLSSAAATAQLSAPMGIAAKGVPKPPPATLGFAPPAPETAPRDSVKEEEESEEDKIRRARMELADLAIARQRARQGVTSETVDQNDQKEETPQVAPAEVKSKVAEKTKEMSAEEIEELAEKERIKLENKAKKQAEKEAMRALKEREEEERERRRLEKEKDIEDARILREEMDRQKQEWLAKKKAKEEKERLEKEAEDAKHAALVAQRRAEREERKRARALAKAKAIEEARKKAEEMVLGDPWTQEQQRAFEKALLEFTSRMDKYERWTAVSNAVGDKSKNQCLMRYRYLKDFIAQRKQIDEAAAVSEQNEIYMNLKQL